MTYRARCLLIALSSALFACGSDTPRTQVMVTVDASPGVRALTRELEVVVNGGPASVEPEPHDWAEAFRQAWNDNAIAWPIPIALVPQNNDASRGYFVIATARGDNDEVIARVRTRSGYVARKTLWLRIVLDDADACRPAANEYCRDVAVQVDDLKPWRPNSDAALPDASADAATPDSASDATTDAPATDGATTDASPLDAAAVTDAASDAGSVDATADTGVDAAPAFDCAMLNCNDNKQCTTDTCDPDVGCVNVNRVGNCDDNNLCTNNDACAGDTCVGTPITCQANASCDVNTGACACNTGARACGAVCRVGAVCCPGQTNGSCGQCGTSTCNGSGTGYDCTGQHGNCTGGSCQGASCGPETGGPCGNNQQRICNVNLDCNWSGCF